MTLCSTVGPFRRRLLATGLVATGLWAAAATGLLLFHDDVLAAFVARQASMQTAYEARLADLRAELRRGGSERAEAREAVEARLTNLSERQAELERRQAALAALSPEADPAVTGALPAPAPPVVPDLGLRRGDGRGSARDTGLRLAALTGRLDGLAAAQEASLGRIQQRASSDVSRLRRALDRTGLDPRRLIPPAAPGLGGPLVPIDADPFAQALAAAARTAGDAQALRRLAAGLPLKLPVRTGHGVASSFGPRLDPFTRGFALHTGLDLKAEMGEAALATAPGRVAAAEPAGGYGNMVEIDHGHGVVTRYAHLASIAVWPGAVVRAGDLVGRVGSTGRSTGAHLHYETRIDGEPVDPQRFLDAGEQLAEPGPP